jgi:hypothetical protein
MCTTQTPTLTHLVVFLAPLSRGLLLRLLFVIIFILVAILVRLFFLRLLRGCNTLRSSPLPLGLLLHLLVLLLLLIEHRIIIVLITTIIIALRFKF